MEEEKSTAATEQQDECEDYAVDVTTASSWYKNVSYDDAKIFIRTNIESAARSFIAIGYYLKLIRDGELYREEGHENIWDFAMAEYGISKSTASRYMSMNDRFSLDGNSPIVDQKYKDFEKSKLQEMLSLTDEQLEQVTPEMKVQEIRAMRQPKEIPYFELGSTGCASQVCNALCVCVLTVLFYQGNDGCVVVRLREIDCLKTLLGNGLACDYAVNLTGLDRRDQGIPVKANDLQVIA